MKKIIAGVILILSATGCSGSIAPVRTYEPEWCKVSEFVTPEGNHLFVYSSPQGSTMEVVSPAARAQEPKAADTQAASVTKATR